MSTPPSTVQIHDAVAWGRAGAPCSRSVLFTRRWCAGARSPVVLTMEETEHIMCTLVGGEIFQQQLCIRMNEGEEIAFSTQGDCPVRHPGCARVHESHLTAAAAKGAPHGICGAGGRVRR